MKRICCIVLFFTSLNAVAQNLVPDSSFEDTLECPTFSQLKLRYWYSPTNGTPDSYCSCFTHFDNIPFAPSQNVNSKLGDCYIGLALGRGSTPDNREYIETEIINGLDSSKVYCVTLYTLRSSKFNIAISNISIGFRNDSTYQNLNYLKMDVDTFYLFTDKIIYDTINWTKLSLKFIANGSEKYLSIGNHSSFEDINFHDYNSVVNPPFLLPQTYYFFDMITLEECPPEPVEHFLVYPNPSSGGSVYLSNYADTVATVTLYNSLGQRVAERMLPAGTNGLVAFEGLASGVYIAVYQTATGYKEEKKVVVLNR